jgi:ABC-2 type transport system ATP-binding protein
VDEPVLGLHAVHMDMFYRILVEQFERRPACYVISTHLIEEVTGLIEDVIIIRAGEILLHESTEALLARGYTVSGPAVSVDAVVAHHPSIGEDRSGGLKSAYILGELDPGQVPAELEVTKLNLQQLFVQLTKE